MLDKKLKLDFVDDFLLSQWFLLVVIIIKAEHGSKFPHWCVKFTIQLKFSTLEYKFPHKTS
jgi:hypothetical protein